MTASCARREFLTHCAGVASSLAIPQSLYAGLKLMDDQSLFEISLAQWSLHRTIASGELNPLDFPRVAMEDFDITAVEFVNGCFGPKWDHSDPGWKTEIKKRSNDLGVKPLLIMIDGQGNLGDPDDAQRKAAVENHHKWVDAAKELGCHSIRVNARSSGSPDDQHKLVVDGLTRLTEFAAAHDINVLVENHGGLSSNGAWLAGVMKAVNHSRCGTLPDFGNFCLDWNRRDEPDAWYDRYQGVRELMPFAKAVSAKSNEFDEHGNEKHTDYRRMMKIVLDAGYRGHVGIEYEGDTLPEAEGIRATNCLLETVRHELSSTV